METNPEQAEATELLGCIAVIKKSDNQTGFWRSIDSTPRILVISKMILYQWDSNFPLSSTLNAEVTQLSLKR